MATAFASLESLNLSDEQSGLNDIQHECSNES